CRPRLWCRGARSSAGPSSAPRAADVPRPGPREVALRVLRRVDEGAYLGLALDGEAQRAGLSPADRALCTALVQGVLKGRERLDHALRACAPRGLGGLDPTTLDLLRLGACQLLDLR